MPEQVPSVMLFPEEYRRQGISNDYASKNGDPYGVFIIPGKYACGRALNIIACNGELTGWDHVSVSIMGQPNQCPAWKEMCLVKSLFWLPSDCVVQFHPPEEEYVNNHNGCLHLWRQVNAKFPMPPTICV